jgi:hypothetical protein
VQAIGMLLVTVLPWARLGWSKVKVKGKRQKAKGKRKAGIVFLLPFAFCLLP